MICAKQFSITTEDAVCFTNSSPLPQAYFAVAYSTTLIPVLGVPGTFSIVGALPSGLALNPATGEISGTSDDGGEVGAFNFTATFTPDDPLISPCSRDFVLNLGIYCVGIGELTWTIVDTHDPSESTAVMAGGDGSFAINRPLNGAGARSITMTSSQLKCLPAAFAQYPATIEIDWNVFLHEVGVGAQAGVDISARRNGVLLLPVLSRATSGPDITESGTLTIATGMLQAGQTYVFSILIATGCTVAGEVVFDGVIRIRPLVPP